MMQLIAAGCVGIFFGILFESFRDVSERYGHLFLGFTIFSALLSGLFLLACTRFCGEMMVALVLLIVGGFVGWAFSRFLNLKWPGMFNSPKN
jgi:hypothetical protein